MQNIQDFQREKDDTLCTMYTRLAWFNEESFDVSHIGSWRNYTCPNETRRCSNEKH